jgi:hypothetical protein
MTVPYDNCMERLEGERMGIVGETCVEVKEQIDQHFRGESRINTD